MRQTITVFKGDGIGPEITDAVIRVMDAAGAELDYEIYNVGEAEYEAHGELIPKAAFESMERNKVLLKSPITTPVGKGFRSSTCSCARNTIFTPISARLRATTR